MTANTDDDRLLVEAAQADPTRFVELYERYIHRVYAYVSRRTRDRAAAEDVTSEVFQQALAHLPRFEWRGVPFAAWLYRIAANAVADHYARAARERGDADVPVLDAEDEEIERRAFLYRAVRTLPPDQRRVIEMRFGDERSIADIARTLGRSEGAVKQLQFRAIQSLREQAERHDA